MIISANMGRALVVVEDAERDRELLERARSFASGDGSSVEVLALATPEEYQEVSETLDAIGKVEGTTYDDRSALEGISGDIDDAAADVLGDVGYRLRTEIAESGDQAVTIMDAADDADCDHVFLPGQRRSPTGKAVFGDRTQRVLLNFNGFVTAEMN
ncbi:universal stress protein [Halobacterium noricense]